MRETILKDIVAAMKSGDKETLTVLRMLKGAMQLEEINKKAELNDEEVVAAISKQIKSRKESIAQFGDRNDLIEKTQSEIDILVKYLPEQLSEEEVLKIIETAFLEVKPESQKDMGKIMGKIMPLLKGKADMGYVNQIIKEKLS